MAQQLEPDASLMAKDIGKHLASGVIDQGTGPQIAPMLFSIAVSLKRIADLIEGAPDQAGLLYYISGIEMNTRSN